MARQYNPLRSLALVSVVAVSGCFESAGAVTLSTDTETGDDTGPGPESLPTSSSGTETSTPGTSSSGTQDPTVPDETSTTDETGSDSTGTGADESSSGSTSGDSSGGETGDSLSLCPLFVDDFEDGSFDPIWDLSYPSSLSEENGEAVLTLTSPQGDQYPRLTLQPLGGLVGASVRMEAGALLPPEFGTQINLIVGGAQGDNIAFSINHTAQLDLQITTQLDDGDFDVQQLSAYDPVNHAWLQIREDAGVLYFETSADGESFSIFHQIASPFELDAARVGIAGTNWDPITNLVDVSARSFEFQCSEES